MILEETKLHEIIQGQRPNSVGFHVYEIPRVVRFTETEGYCQGWEGGNGKLLSNGLRVPVGEVEILDMNGGVGTTTCMSVMLLNCIF